jgi:hypothetical protein
MCGVPLFARRLLVGLQDPIDPGNNWRHFYLLSFGLLPRYWYRIGDRFAHRPPVHAQLLRYSFDRPDAMLVLAPDLLE